MTDQQVVYIIGVGRSGTSLLMTLLNGHSQIAFTPETHFLRFYLANQEIKSRIENRGPQAFFETLQEDDYFMRLAIDPEVLLEPYLNEEKPFSLNQVYKDILDIYLKRKRKAWIGDKDPRYIDYLEAVHELYPKAKIIQIYRDPRDVVLSKTKAAWSAHRPFWMNAMISQIQIKRGRKKAKTLFGENYYEFPYESLLTEPTQALGKLLNFIGLDFEESMFELSKSAEELVDPSEMQWKDNTFKALKGGNKEKWRTQLSPFQVRCIEIICKEWFQNLDYQYAEQKVGWPQELFIRTVFGIEQLQQVLYDYKFKSQLKQQLKEVK